MPHTALSSWLPFESNWIWRVFFVTLVGAGLWEVFLPSRPLIKPFLRRWGSHGLLFLIGNTLVILLAPVSMIGLAVAIHDSDYGLLMQKMAPSWLNAVALVLLLDLIRYAGHYLLHSLGPLWRVHRVHHSDPDLDITTGLRFHPLEVLLAYGLSLGVIFALAPSPVAVLAFEVVVSVQSLLAHANVSLPSPVDRMLRYVFITPNMHHIHHSDEEGDQRTNLGVVFPWWDRLFGTYRESMLHGDAYGGVGLKDFPDRGLLSVPYLLTLPFRRLEPDMSEELSNGLVQAAGDSEATL